MNAIVDYYNDYDEEGRLYRNHTNAIERLTTMHYLDKLLPPHAVILDGCAGTGVYAFALAEQGHVVTARDLVPRNVDIMRRKQAETPLLHDLGTGDIGDLSAYAAGHFDVVLCMGAFYHVGADERGRIMGECLRVLKPEGLLVIAYLNNLGIALHSLGDELANMDEVLETYANHTQDGLFIGLSPADVEGLASAFDTSILAHIAVDGMKYLLIDKINRASEANFAKYMKLHLATCTDPGLLAASLHNLIVLQKKEQQE